MKINKLCHYIITGWQIKKQEDRYKKLKYILKKANSDVLVIWLQGKKWNDYRGFCICIQTVIQNADE